MPKTLKKLATVASLAIVAIASHLTNVEPSKAQAILLGGEVAVGVNYWVTTDSRYPGVYYRSIRQSCRHGGTKEGRNCKIFSFSPGDVRTGVDYWVSTDRRWAGVYYRRNGGRCRFGGIVSGANCKVVEFYTR